MNTPVRNEAAHEGNGKRSDHRRSQNGPLVLSGPVSRGQVSGDPAKQSKCQREQTDETPCHQV